MKRILALFLCSPGLIGAMEVPPQQSRLVTLHSDLKKYLLPYLVSGSIPEAAKTIIRLSRVNKSFAHFINMPENMLVILKSYRYPAHAIDLVGYSGQRSSKETNRPKLKNLPVVRDKIIQKWLIEKQGHLVLGQELLNTVIGKNVEVLQVLLANPRIDLNYQDGFGFTPLMEAVRARSEKSLVMVQMLLEAQANPDLRNNSSGNTALHQAAHRGKTEIIELMLENGADKKLTNHRNQTAFDRAAYQEQYYRHYSTYSADRAGSILEMLKN